MSILKTTVGIAVIVLMAGGLAFHFARLNREVAAELFAPRAKVVTLENELRLARQHVLNLDKEAAELPCG